MTESMMFSLMELFAIISNLNSGISSAISRSFVETYLKRQFSAKQIETALVIFDKYYKEFSILQHLNKGKRTSSLSVKILSICNRMNNELHTKNKFLILFSLIQFSKYFEENTSSEDEFHQNIEDTVKTISQGLLINENDYNNCRVFITQKFYNVPDKNRVLIISGESSFNFTEINHLQKSKLISQIFFLKICQTDMYIFFYIGKSNLEMRGKYIFPKHIYILPRGSSLKENGLTVYYSDVVSAFLKSQSVSNVSMQVSGIKYTYPRSKNGIQKLNFTASSGEMIGIMGGSGTGKSTLMNILNGSLLPQEGKILINGIDLHEDYNTLKGIMGYIPQDDLLIEELTVYQNLWFNAQLCLGNLPARLIREKVDKILYNLDLFEIKDLKVGSPLDKLISGGQRKRLNIALELIMEPHILYADEPTSGLSSKDSENVMQLLKDQAVQGNIVIINIHQPSSELFKLFDKLLLLDKGGHPVYFGNPLEAVSYLKSIAQRADAAEIECQSCGNVKTDDLLNVIEAKQVSEYGEFTAERLISPEKWFAFYKENTPVSENTSLPEKLPELKYKAPGKIKQFFTYSCRNLNSKIADRQYILFALFIPPVLGLILGVFSKYVKGSIENHHEYIFNANENIPAYIFMSVIVALFIGLIISAEEIIKDRKIIKRESFLNLSRTAYLNSKIIFLFFLVAIQMAIFVWVGNGMLEIKGMKFSYWIILFTTACFAVLLGLNISAGLKSVISIYINIPFILVPLILLAGVIIKFDKMHYSVASVEYTPFAGDIMASRWAYEALVINQFRNNEYQKHFFHQDQTLANCLYEINYLIPELLNKVNDYEQAVQSNNIAKQRNLMAVLSHGCNHIINDIPDIFSTDEIKDLLLRRKFLLSEKAENLEQKKDEALMEMISKYSSNANIISLRNNHHNAAVNDLVLNNNEMRKIKEYPGKLVRKDSPIYQIPDSKIGRAHFYAAYKYLGNVKINTIWFNIGVIWLMTIFLYVILVFDVFRKVLNFNFRKGHPELRI
jgi:ABC transport system ATP-binding/permease protein